MKKVLYVLMLITICVCSSTVYAANADFMVTGSYVSCGEPTLIGNIPSIIPRISSSLYNAVMIIVPVILVIMGIIDLVKGIMSQKEDEIKKGRQSLINRLITGLIIFLVVMIVKLFVGVIGGASDGSRIVDCVDCFISNDC